MLENRSTNEILQYIEEGMPSSSPIDAVVQDEKSSELSFNEIFDKRATAFLNGIHLFIDNLSIAELKANPANHLAKREQLKTAVNKLHSDSAKKIRDSSTIEESKRLLDEFLCKVTLVLEDNIAMNSTKIAKQLSIAERVKTWEGGRKPLITVSANSDSEQLIYQIEVPRCDLTYFQKKEFVDLLTQPEKDYPKWFKVMPAWEQKYLLAHLRNPDATMDNINSKILSIPTALRHVPGLANYSEHILRIYNKEPDGQYHLAVESRRERSGIVCPVDLYKKDENVERQRLTDDNVAQLITSTLKERALRYLEKWPQTSQPIKLPILVQTLLSPGVLSALLNGGSNNNSMMIENKNEAIRKLKEAFANPTTEAHQNFFSQLGLDVNSSGMITYTNDSGKSITVEPVIVSTNHSVNIWRILPVPLKQEEKTPNNNNAKTLLEAANEFVSVHQNDASAKNDIDILLNAMKDYQTTPSLAPARRHRPLFLSSLEQIIAEKSGGVGYGSCKSGKDRKGMETLHTDAMLVYQSRYHVLPKYNDTPENREKFVAIFVELYQTYHHQEVASLNASGSRGLKELNHILPEDIQEALGSKLLKEANFMGSLNKVKNKLLKKRKEKIRLKKELQDDTALQSVLSLRYLRDKMSTGNIQDDFYAILSDLKIISQDLHGAFPAKKQNSLKKLFVKNNNHPDPLLRLINLMEASKSNKSLTTEPVLSQVIKAIGTLQNQIETRYPESNQLSFLKDTCDRAIENLQQREGLIESFHTKTRLQYYKDEADFHRILSTLPELQGSAAVESLGSLVYPSTPNIDANHFRVSALTNAPGAVIIEKRNKQGQGSSQLMQIPHDLDPKKIWEQAYTAFLAGKTSYQGLDAFVLDQIYHSIANLARLNDKEITQNDFIPYFEKRGIYDAETLAKDIYAKYNSLYQRAMYQEYKGEKFPSDQLIKIAIQHIESSQQINPNQPIRISDVYSSAYAEAIMLYCKSQNYSFVNQTDYQSIEKKVTSRRAQTFQSLLNKKQEALGYEDKLTLAKKINEDFPILTSTRSKFSY